MSKSGYDLGPIEQHFDCDQCRQYPICAARTEDESIILADGDLCYHVDVEIWSDFLRDRVVVIPSLRNRFETEWTIITANGLVTQPEFLDNGFVQSNGKKPNLKKFYRQLDAYGKEVRFAVAPDNMMDLGIQLTKKYPYIHWIYPLHDIHEAREAVKHFCFIGFPHRKQWRNYSLRQFLMAVPFDQRWYLGFFNESHPYILLEFKGLDSTLPSFYAGRLGKLWHTWKTAEKYPKTAIKRVWLEYANLINFTQALDGLLKQRSLDQLKQLKEVHLLANNNGIIAQPYYLGLCPACSKDGILFDPATEHFVCELCGHHFDPNENT